MKHFFLIVSDCSQVVSPFFQGISFSIIGPTLLDLQELTNSTTDEISIVLIIKYVGLEKKLVIM